MHAVASTGTCTNINRHTPAVATAMLLLLLLLIVGVVVGVVVVVVVFVVHGHYGPPSVLA